MINRSYESTPSPPEVEQLVELRDMVIRSTVKRGALKSFGKKVTSTTEGEYVSPKAHYAISHVDFVQETPLNEDDLTRIRRGLAVRISAQSEYGKPREWSLKFYKRNAVEKPNGDWDNSLSRYRFEWNSRNVKLAERVIRFAGIARPDSKEADLYNSLESFHIPDDMATIWGSEIDMSAVTKDDIDYIRTDIANYLEVLDQVARQSK